MKAAKAISLSRPWPYAILQMGKRIENRSRKDGWMPAICRHRGALYLHAAKSWDKGFAEFCRVSGVHPERLPNHLISAREAPHLHPRSGIVGRCKAVAHLDPEGCVWEDPGQTQLSNREYVRGRWNIDIHPASLDMRWWMGGYALLLAEVLPTPFVDCPGRLGCWTVPVPVLQQLEAA